MIIAALVILVTSVASPQEPVQGPGKPPPPEKRWERDSEKIKKAVSLTSDELSKIKTVFMDFYKSMDALMQKNKGQRPAKEEVDKLISKRNDGVKKILSKDKYDRFLEIEKELGPPKPPKKE